MTSGYPKAMQQLARAFLDDPHWDWHAARTLGAEVARPVQYARRRYGPGALCAGDVRTAG